MRRSIIVISLTLTALAFSTGTLNIMPKLSGYDPGPALYVDRAGGRVGSDPSIDSALSGGSRPSVNVVLGAFCRNALDWAHDRTLNLDVIVSSDPRLIFAAQTFYLAMAQGDKRAVEVVRNIEEWIWSGRSGSSASLDETLAWVRTWSDSAMKDVGLEYVASRWAAQTDEIDIDRYVVYLASRTLSEQLMVYADLENMPDVSMGPHGGSGSIRIAGESAQMIVNTESCAARDGG